MKWPVIILFFFIVSCNNGNRTMVNYSFGKQSCAKDSSHTYEVYVPSHPATCTEMPVIVVFDPHGSGSSALKNFIQAAENYHCIIAASDLIRNNLPDYLQKANILIGDIKEKYKPGQVYLAGFSGGARMALSYAVANPVDGVLVSGALASGDEIKRIKGDIFALIGLGDFNFNELVPFLFNESSVPSNLHFYITGNSHEWPSADEIDFAAGNLILQNKTSGLSCMNKETEKKYSARQQNTVDSLIKNRSFLMATLLCRNMISVPGLHDKKFFSGKMEELKVNSSLNVELNNLGKSLQLEAKIREAYFNSMLTKDERWWEKELNDLDHQISMEGEKYLIYAYKRVRAFLGIASYSMVKNYLQADDLDNTSKILKIYRLVEPENADMLFFTAVCEYKKGEKKSSKDHLMQALSKGFNDFALLSHYFPNDFITVEK